MNHNPDIHRNQTGAASVVKLAIVFAIVGILAFAVTMLPKGFKDDLSLIGQGKVSLVLVHDKNLVGSTKMMELLNKVRSDYQDSVEFLAVDIATPTGQRFSQQQQAGAVDLVLFDADGQMRNTLSGRTAEQELRSVLDEIVQDEIVQ